MKLAAIPTLALVIAASGLSGCASIISGSQQSISVTAKTPDSADVAGATCSFENTKGKWFAPTPGSVTVHRAYAPLLVHCDHADWTGDTEVKSSTKGMAFGNILFGGVIGAGVDASTGAAYDYPQLITVPMKARASAAPAAAAGGVAPAAPAAAPPAVPAPAAAAAVPPPAAIAAPAPVSSIQPARSVPGGQDGFSASRIAQDAACHPQPAAVMTAKGPGFETYSVACISGDALAIRCEFGNCRVLR